MQPVEASHRRSRHTGSLCRDSRPAASVVDRESDMFTELGECQAALARIMGC